MKKIYSNFNQITLQISTQLRQNQYIEMIQNKITELESKIE